MPRTREQVIWDFIQLWLKKANSRLKMAELCMEQVSADPATIVFYSHQAVEVYVKACLVYYQIPFSKCYDIKILADLFPPEEKQLADEVRKAEWLSPFGRDFPDPTTPGAGIETAQNGLREARRISQLVGARLGDYLAKGRP
jgi:HEPN domain-containing protein